MQLQVLRLRLLHVMLVLRMRVAVRGGGGGRLLHRNRMRSLCLWLLLRLLPRHRTCSTSPLRRPRKVCADLATAAACTDVTDTPPTAASTAVEIGCDGEALLLPLWLPKLSWSSITAAGAVGGSVASASASASASTSAGRRRVYQCL